MKNFTLSGFIAVLLLFTFQANAINSSISVSTESTSSLVLNSNQSEMNLQFHFGDIGYFDVKTPNGIFTEIHMGNAYSTNRIGEPILPAQRKLIAIPFGAEVNVQVSSFNVQTIELDDYGIKNALMPLQYDLPKDMDASDVPFQYKAEAYTAKSFNESEIATVEILGVMRGVRIARVSIEPVRYNPSSNQLEVYNDIEVTLSYNNADWGQTNQMFTSTYSPYFDVAYRSLLNVDDVYDDHPDLMTFPVHMLIVSHPMFTEALQPFIEWKTMMGYHLTVAYTDEIGSSSSEIQTWIHNQYNEGVANGTTPDFVVFVGDVQQVPASATGSATERKTDLYYCSVDGDYFPEMYYGRLSATNEAELTAQLDKIIYYEKYEFETPEYLDDVTLIAGADAGWNPKVGQPTILYGTENYFNTAHGYENIYVYLDSYSGCYDDEKFQTSFINYTAHCAETVWADPHLGISDVNNMNNPNEYPIAVGNCCMSADFGYNECIGEAFLREENSGAVGYIGSSPSSYWFEDFYWSVGAFPIQGENNGYVPTAEETTMGTYDAVWGESYNCLHSLAFVGNLAVTEVNIQGYASHSSPLYYWQAYNTLGDPSLLPYNTQGTENTVSHMDIVPIGLTQYEVNAEPGSYVAISKDGVLYGTGYVDESGTAICEMEPIMEAGDVNIVVTKPQYIPYIVTVPAAALDGPFLTISDFVFDNGTQAVDYNTSVSMDVSVSNLGTEASDDITITLIGDDEYCILTSAATVSVGTIASDDVVLIENAFTFDIADNAPDMYKPSFDVSIEGTSKEIWESTIAFNIYAPVPDFGTYTIDDASGNNNGRIDAGETVNIAIQTLNNGHALAIEGSLGVSSSSSFITVNTANVDVAEIAAENMQEVIFSITASEETPVGTIIDINLNYTAGNYGASKTIQEAIGLVLEDFETGDFSQFDWQFSSNPWTIVDDVVYEGVFASKSGNISDSQNTSMEIDYSVESDGDLSFYYKVSSESGYDYLKFYINDTEVDSWSGEADWTEAVYELSAGDYNFRWVYSKDGSVSNGEDCAWIDYIILPMSGDNTLTAGFNVDDNTPCAGSSSTFTATSTGATTWNWTFEGGDPASSNEQNPTVLYTTAGSYDVTLEVGDGTNTASVTIENFISVQSCTGIDVLSSSVKLYPNPNNGVFYMDIQGMDQANITILNSVGSIVYSETNIALDNSMKRMDLSNEAEGIYMIIVENNDTRIIEKIIIK